MSEKLADLGPLTQSITKENDGPPNVLVQEWEQKLEQTGDFVLLNAGAIKRGKQSISSWWSMGASVAEDQKQATNREFIQAIDPTIWERMLTSVSHPHRLTILQTLFPEPQSVSTLSTSLGIKGGALYYHLRELVHAGLVEQKKKLYQLSCFGVQFLLNIGDLIRGVQFSEAGELRHTSWTKR